MLVLFVGGSLLFSGCVSEPDPLPPPATKLTEFYYPRKTDNRLVYQYSGFYSGRADSVFFVDYLGVATELADSASDGNSPIHKIQLGEFGVDTRTEMQIYISDSLVIEYGRDCRSNLERFIPLKDSLAKGVHWTAAQGFHAPNYQISYIATVVEHYDNLQVYDGFVVDDVWQVIYEVTKTKTESISSVPEFELGARRVAYYAKGYGKVLELAYSPENKLLWKNELLRMENR